MLVRRSRRVAESGLVNLLHPDVRTTAEIVLTQPYDPNKVPILLVHGLQSTPVTFLRLVTELESNPEIARQFQFWHFYYSTGTPVLLNALRLREQLGRTARIVDPGDDDFATHRIVVVGHSMGGLLGAHARQFERRRFVEEPLLLFRRSDCAAIRRRFEFCNTRWSSDAIRVWFAPFSWPPRIAAARWPIRLSVVWPNRSFDCRTQYGRFRRFRGGKRRPEDTRGCGFPQAIELHFCAHALAVRPSTAGARAACRLRCRFTPSSGKSTTARNRWRCSSRELAPGRRKLRADRSKRTQRF